jgi:hypothetical protein
MASSSDDDQDPGIQDSEYEIGQEDDEIGQEDDEIGEEDDDEITQVITSGWKEKLLGPGGRSAGAKSGQTGVSTKAAIERLDQRERRLSFAAGGASVLFGILIYVVQTHAKTHVSKSPDAPVTTLVLALACGGLLLGATFLGRRAPVGFVALFAFLIFGTSSILLGAPFLALAVWLLYRSYRIQREAASKLRAARPETTPRSASTRKSGASTASSSRTSRPAPKGRAKKGPATPEANKRYTPKRPTPPAPKPSRRERKASQASD